MLSDYEKLMEIFHPTSWSQLLFRVGSTLLLFCLSVILNVFLGLVLGGLTGWLFGGWISAELALFGTQISSSEIYKLTALVGLITGFVATFFKFAPIIQTRKDM